MSWEQLQKFITTLQLDPLEAAPVFLADQIIKFYGDLPVNLRQAVLGAAKILAHEPPLPERRTFFQEILQPWLSETWLTISDASKSLGIPRPTLSYYKNADLIPSPERLLEFSRYFVDSEAVKTAEERSVISALFLERLVADHLLNKAFLPFAQKLHLSPDQMPSLLRTAADRIPPGTAREKSGNYFSDTLDSLLPKHGMALKLTRALGKDATFTSHIREGNYTSPEMLLRIGEYFATSRETRGSLPLDAAWVQEFQQELPNQANHVQTWQQVMVAVHTASQIRDTFGTEKLEMLQASLRVAATLLDQSTGLGLRIPRLEKTSNLLGANVHEQLGKQGINPEDDVQLEQAATNMGIHSKDLRRLLKGDHNFTELFALYPALLNRLSTRLHYSKNMLIGWLTLDRVFRHELQQGRAPTIDARIGYDIASQENSGRVRYIEVTGLSATTSPPYSLRITRKRWEEAKQIGNHYFLYVILNTNTDHPTLISIQNPYRHFQGQVAVSANVVRLIFTFFTEWVKRHGGDPDQPGVIEIPAPNGN